MEAVYPVDAAALAARVVHPAVDAVALVALAALAAHLVDAVALSAAREHAVARVMLAQDLADDRLAW